MPTKFWYDGVRQHSLVFLLFLLLLLLLLFSVFFYHNVAARNCGHLATPLNGIINSYVFNYGSTVEYICDKGYTLVGSKQRVCQANQTWNGTSPHCTSRLSSFILTSLVTSSSSSSSPSSSSSTASVLIPLRDA